MLKIESLTRRYPHVTALDGLNMEIGHGQLYGFVGPNGAGKTTTIRIISGLCGERRDGADMGCTKERNRRCLPPRNDFQQ